LLGLVLVGHFVLAGEGALASVRSMGGHSTRSLKGKKERTGDRQRANGGEEKPGWPFSMGDYLLGL